MAPDKPYLDRVTNKIVQPVTTMQIYKGAIPFVFIQLFMVGVLIAFPNLVSGGLKKAVDLDTSQTVIEVQQQDKAADTEMDAAKLFGSEPPASAASAP